MALSVTVTRVTPVATFVWTRLDKWRDHGAAAIAKQPATNIQMEGLGGARWHVGFSLAKRDEYTIRLDALAVPETFVMNFGEAQAPTCRREPSRHVQTRTCSPCPSFVS